MKKQPNIILLVMDSVRPTRLGFRLKHPDATN